MRERLRTVVNLAPNLSTCNLSKSNNDLREVNGRLFLLNSEERHQICLFIAARED